MFLDRFRFFWFPLINAKSELESFKFHRHCFHNVTDLPIALLLKISQLHKSKSRKKKKPFMTIRANQQFLSTLSSTLLKAGQLLSTLQPFLNLQGLLREEAALTSILEGGDDRGQKDSRHSLLTQRRQAPHHLCGK